MAEKDRFFKILESLFTDEWANVTRPEKAKHFFILMRFISIKFPIEAQAFNVNGINKEQTLDYWNTVLKHRFKGPPQWLKTPTAKANATDKEKQPTKKVVDFYMRKYMLGSRDYQYLKQYFKEELFAELFDIEKQVKEFGEEILA